MGKKTLKIEATYVYEIEIDTDSSYIKDYDKETDLIDDLVHYRFTTLPVIGNGVEVKDIEVDNWDVQ
jgi:hypothetical protein